MKQLQDLAEKVMGQKGFLVEYQQQVSGKLNYDRYAVDSYISTWGNLLDKLTKRVQFCKSNSDAPVLFCDIVNLLMPRLCSIANETLNWIQRAKINRPESPAEALKSVVSALKLDQFYSKPGLSEEQIMLVPFQIVGKFFLIVKQLKTQPATSKQEQIDGQYLQRSYNVFEKAFTQLRNRSEEEKIMMSKIETELVLGQYEAIPEDSAARRFQGRLGFLLRKAQKELKRKNGILQLICGQQVYIKGLDEYIKYIKKPIEELSLEVVSQKNRKKLFSNIEQIRDFHFSFWNSLKEMFQNYHSKQLYGEVIKFYINYFKIYQDYIFNAESAQKLFTELEKAEKPVAKIANQYFIDCKKKASDQLMQPTFKIARYQALLGQIIKRTRAFHPDFLSITEACKSFKKMLTAVNETVDRILRKNRLNSLQALFGTPEQPVEVEGREFCLQTKLEHIRQQRCEPVQFICFSDMILVVEEATNRIYRKIPIDKHFFVRRDQNTKFYRNVLTVISAGSTMTFSAGSQDMDANKADEVYQLLKKLSAQISDTMNMVFVKVLGTEQIGSTSFAKYTEYIVEIKYLELKKLLHIRFSTMMDLVSNMKKLYGKSLEISDEESLRKNWFSSHKSKTIEDRKRLIEQILQTMFNQASVKGNPCHLLTAVSLPLNFYSIARESLDKRLSSSSLTQKCSLSTKQKKEAFTILCATQLELGRDLYHDMDPIVRKQKEKAPKISIYITTMEKEPVSVKITDFDTVEDVCNRVSTIIGLRSNRDFRLFHEIGKKQLRVLEHEQKITRLFKFPGGDQASIEGVMSGFTNSVKKVFSPETYPTLIFKKYYYLPFEIELAQARNDLTRLRLLVYQIFFEVKEMKYQLFFEEYLLFTAMLIYIQKDQDIVNCGLLGEDDLVRKDLIEQSYIKRIIPDGIIKLKNFTRDEWYEKVAPLLRSLDKHIEGVLLENKERIKSKPLKSNTNTKAALYLQYRHLCGVMVLNKIKSNPIFGSNIFYVQPHDSTYKALKKANVNVAYNMWLAVKVQTLNLLSPSSKQVVLELNYSDINDTEVFSESIKFKMEHYIDMREYRLNTYQSFEISQLVNYNKALNQVLAGKLDSSDLSARVKTYCQELNGYRQRENEVDLHQL